MWVVDFHGATKWGTGFRIGPDLLLTNWHVTVLTDSYQEGKSNRAADS